MMLFVIFLGKHVKSKKIYLCALISVVSLIFVSIYHQFIFGNNAYIFLSPNSDYLINYLAYRAYISANYLSGFTNNMFAFGLGENPFGAKPFLVDPFTLLNFLPFTFSFIVLLQFYLKLLLIAISSYYALQARNKSSNNVVFATLFTFCGMFVYWSTQDTSFTAMSFVVVQWLGYELYRKNNKLSYFIILSLPLFMLSSTYWGITFNIFLVVFILLDIAWDDDLFKNKFIFLGKLVLGYCVVLALSAWSILPNLFVLAHNGRVSQHLSNSIWHTKLNTQFGLLEPLDLYNVKLYTQLILRGFGNYVIPFDKIWVSSFSGALWYNSIFILVSAVSYIFQQSSSSSKIKYNVLIVFSILFGLLPLVILLFNGFSDVRFRWTWFFLLPIFICAVKFWQSKPNLNKFRLATIVLGLIFFLSASYAYYIGDLYFSDKNVLYTYVEIAIVFSLLFLVSYLRRYTFILLACIGLVDTLFNSYMFIHNAQPIDADYQVKHQYYYDNTINAVNKIKSEDNSVFYRMDKTYSSLNLCPFCGLNENLIQGYNGVKQYISTPNPAYFKFSADMDAKPYYNFIFGFDGRSDVLRMLGVKYLLSKSESDISGYSYQQKVDDIYIYQVNNYYGIGHIFHDYITRDDFMQLSTTDKDLVFSRCTILDNKQVSTFGVRQISSQDCLGHESVLHSNLESFNLAVLNGRHVFGSANLVTTGILYLAIPYDQGFRAIVDGKSVSVLNVSDGFVGLELTAGKHSIELDYFPPLLKIGFIISGLTLLGLIIYTSSMRVIQSKKKHNE